MVLISEEIINLDESFHHTEEHYFHLTFSSKYGLEIKDYVQNKSGFFYLCDIQNVEKFAILCLQFPSVISSPQ